MRRLSILLQAVGILVAALACFSEVCDADNNGNTGAPITTGVSTAASTNMTTTVANMTTAVSTMTTEVSDVTTAVSNMPTADSDMTTATSHMTTKSEMTSTTPSGTSASSSPAPTPRWEVKDKDGKLCMLMEFQGTVTLNIDYRTNVTKWIPSDANTTESDCSSSSYSAFVLEFRNLSSFNMRVVFNFTNKGDHYKLYTLGVGIFKPGWGEFTATSKDFFYVPMGDYYNCSSFIYYSFGDFAVNLKNPKFQPFVQKTKGGNNWGQAFHCGSWFPVIISLGVGPGGVIAIVIASVVIIAVIIGVTICIVKRRRKASGQPYSRF